MTYSIPDERKRELCSTPVTLDGRPAAICGTKSLYARVATLPNGPSYEYTWWTADRIVRENSGRFTS